MKSSFHKCFKNNLLLKCKYGSVEKNTRESQANEVRAYFWLFFPHISKGLKAQL